MGIYGFCKGGGNRIVKEGKISIQGKVKRTSPGKAMFTVRKIRV